MGRKILKSLEPQLLDLMCTGRELVHGVTVPRAHTGVLPTPIPVPSEGREQSKAKLPSSTVSCQSGPFSLALNSLGRKRKYPPVGGKPKKEQVQSN